MIEFDWLKFNLALKPGEGGGHFIYFGYKGRATGKGIDFHGFGTKNKQVGRFPQNWYKERVYS